MISFSLDKPIACEKICQEIKRMLDRYNTTSSISNTVLVISICPVTQETNDLIPKLEDRRDASKRE